MTNEERLQYVREVDPQAIEEWEARTLHQATSAREVDVYAPEGILSELGPVHAITYTGTLQGDTELYEHTFKGNARPDLMVDARNSLHLVGGNYHVADVGIVDGAGNMRRDNPWEQELDGYKDQQWAKYVDDKDERAAAKLERAKDAALEAVRTHRPEAYFTVEPLLYSDLTELGKRVSALASRDKNRRDIALGKVFLSDELKHVPDNMRYTATTDGHTLSLLPLADSVDVEFVQNKNNLSSPEDGQNWPDVSQVMPSPVKFATFEASALRSLLALIKEEEAATNRQYRHKEHKGRILIELSQDQPMKIVPTITHATWPIRRLSSVYHLIGAGGDGDYKQEESYSIDPAYLKRALAGSSSVVEIGLVGDPYSPIQVSRADGEIHVIMPMRQDHHAAPKQDDIEQRESQVTKKNPTSHFGNLMWPPFSAPLLHSLAALSTRPPRDTPRMYGAISLYDADQREGMREDHEAHLLELYAQSPHQFEAALGAYLARKYRFLWDAEYRSNPVSANAARQLELAATTDAERHHWRRIKGQARRSNPVATDRINPDSPVVNAGFLAMAGPGGSPYGLPQVNAGALAAAPNYPGDYSFPGVTNGSHGLLGPQIQRNVPGQPIANPVTKADGRWHRKKDSTVGTLSRIDAGDTSAIVYRYEPRKYPLTARAAAKYEQEHGQELPKGTKYIAVAWGYTLDGDEADHYFTAHKTQKAAKRAAEREMRRMRAEGETLAGTYMRSGA
jgi:hypothetical protein|tara:strand:+ start:1812 stop:4013 length:2202 start_codon:yes stop_codon:yes gene_type:complete